MTTEESSLPTNSGGVASATSETQPTQQNGQGEARVINFKEVSDYQAAVEALVGDEMMEMNDEDLNPGDDVPQVAEPTVVTPLPVDPDGEEDLTPAEKAAQLPQVKLRPQNQLEMETLQFKKRNVDWTWQQAEDAARGKLGIKTDVETPVNETVTTAPSLETVAGVDARIQELEAAHAEAMGVTFDLEKAGEIQREILRLNRIATKLELVEESARESKEQSARAEFDQKWENSSARANTDYPALLNPLSPLAMRVWQIDRTLKEQGNELFSDPEKLIKIAKMAADELGPDSTGRGVVAKSTPPSVQPSLPKPVLTPASGNARTTHVSSTAQPIVLKSVEDYENLIASL